MRSWWGRFFASLDPDNDNDPWYLSLCKNVLLMLIVFFVYFFGRVGWDYLSQERERKADAERAWAAQNEADKAAEKLDRWEDTLKKAGWNEDPDAAARRILGLEPN